MFKKYFLYELKNSYRLPLYTVSIFLGIALLSLLAGLFKFQALLYLVFTLTGIAFFAVLVNIINTIYKTIKERLFSKTGYLTFMMPVRTNTILMTKILINLLYFCLYPLALMVAILSIEFALKHIYDTTSDYNIISSLINTIAKAIVNDPVYTILNMLQIFVGILCYLIGILFLTALFNSGLFRHEKGFVKFVVFVCLIIAINLLSQLKIIPFTLYYNDIDKVFLIFSNLNLHDTLAAYYERTGVYPLACFDFSSILWMVLVIIFGYFGSYKLINNNLELE